MATDLLDPDGTTAWRETLSDREAEIAALVGQGFTHREIGQFLSIAPHTVTNHLYHIYQKLDVHNRVELTRLVGPTG